MAEIELVLSVIALFLIRIGIPLVLLITFGTILDRWLRNQHEETYQSGEHKQSR